MDRQRVIDNLESIARDLETISGFFNLINEFMDKPISKKQVQDFCEKYVLDTFMDANDLKSLYARLSLEKSKLNGEMLYGAIGEEKTLRSTKIIDSLRNRFNNAIDGVFLLIANTNTELANKGFPDLPERIMALRRATYKVKYVLTAPLLVPINIDQFSELEVKTDDYLTKDLGQVIDEVKEHLKSKFNFLDNFTLLCVFNNSTHLIDQMINKNNWISLRNFILYLDSFTEY